MKYCPQCGTLLDDDIQFCTNCGAFVTAHEPTPPQSQPSPEPMQPEGTLLPPYNTTGRATASLILGIISIVFVCCLSVFGVILGVIGIVLAVLDRRATPPQLRPSRAANAGLVCSIIGTSLGGVCALLAFALALIEYA